jgi:hypothetical protein
VTVSRFSPESQTFNIDKMMSSIRNFKLTTFSHKIPSFVYGYTLVLSILMAMFQPDFWIPNSGHDAIFIKHTFLRWNGPIQDSQLWIPVLDHHDFTVKEWPTTKKLSKITRNLAQTIYRRKKTETQMYLFSFQSFPPELCKYVVESQISKCQNWKKSKLIISVN